MRTVALWLAMTASAFAQTVPVIPQTGRTAAGLPVVAKHDIEIVLGTKADLSSLSADNAAARIGGATDATAGILASVATGRTVYLPTGSWHITNTLTLAPGQCLTGDGRTQSVIRVGSDFNPSATSVIVAASSEPGACIHDIGIVFDQPSDQGNRANFKTLSLGCTTGTGGSGCIYPPAITAPGAARARFERVRISGAWYGLNLNGNVGGLYANDLEVGALNTGISVDGGMDFCHIAGYHFWPFGLATGALYSGVYSDGATVAANLGRCDDWDIRGLSSFMGQVNLLSTATQGAITNLLMDGDNANLNIFGGFWNIANLTSTKGTASPNPAVTVTGGATTITGLDIRGSSPNALIFQSGGILKAVAGRLNQNALASSAVVQTSGRMSLDSLEMAPGGGVRTAPYVSSTATEFSLHNSSWNQKGSSTGTAVQLGVDGVAMTVQDNDFGGWGFLPYGGGTQGTYGPNKVGVFGFTPVIRPTTPGTWAPSYSVQNGRYWYRGDGIEFEINLVFATNAYTGTLGGMVITGLPFAVAPISNAAGDGDTAAVTSQAFVVLASGYTSMIVQIQSPPTTLVLSQTGSGSGAIGMGASSFPPSTSGMQLSIHGFIPTN